MQRKMEGDCSGVCPFVFTQVPIIEKCSAIKKIQQSEFVYSFWLSGVLRLHLSYYISNVIGKKYSFDIGVVFCDTFC